MGFCILGGKENYLRKLLSEKLTSLGKTIGMGAAPAQYTEKIQEIYDERGTIHRMALGTGTSGTYSAISVPGYGNLTASNFSFVVTSAKATAVRNPGASGGGGSTGTIYPSISYNSSTGVVTVSNANHGSFGSEDAHVGELTLTGTLYAYYTE